jgi:CheY-like chemotaxis protein
MAQDTVGRIFEPFFSTKFNGRGLGLATVLGIVRNHGGALAVHTELDRGTTFRVLLPFADCDSVGSPSADEGDSTVALEQGSGLVLVVDDEEIVRTLAERILRHAGYQVLCANDGVEALDLIRDRSSELRAVLLDLAMPRMNGLETLDAIREHDPNLPIILSSGFSGAELEERLRGDPRSSFIQKPYRTTALIRSIFEAIQTAP